MIAVGGTADAYDEVLLKMAVVSGFLIFVGRGQELAYRTLEIVEQHRRHRSMVSAGYKGCCRKAGIEHKQRMQPA